MSESEQKAVLVVGAGGGVGAAVTGTLLARDFAVIGTVCNESEAVRIRRLHPAIADVQVADLSQASSTSAIVAKMLGKLGGRLAGAVVCAGISPPGPLETASLEVLRRTFEINVIAAVAVYKACMPLLRATRGKLVLISSSAGKAAFPFLGVYVSSKHALEGLCDVMRQEAREWGVDVLLFEPGGIRTDMVTGTITEIRRQWGQLDSDMQQLYERQFGRFLGVAQAAVADGMAPQLVAAAIVDALQDPQSKPRYVLGQDAIALLHAKQGATDVEMDALFEDIYAKSEVSIAADAVVPRREAQ